MEENISRFSIAYILLNRLKKMFSEELFSKN